MQRRKFKDGRGHENDESGDMIRQMQDGKGQGRKMQNRGREKEKEDLPSLHDALHDVLPTHSRIPSHINSDHGREERRKHREFAAILAQLDRDAIATLCLQVSEECRYDWITLLFLLLKVDNLILSSAHILWPVRFSDHHHNH